MMSTGIRLELQADSQATTAQSPPIQPLTYAQDHAPRFVEELRQLIRFPSVSAQPRHAGDVAQCAGWLARHLEAIGMAGVRVMPTQRHPLVYAEWMGAHARPTVLIYGHYDVQPADPLRQWRSPPFAPVVRGDNLYGRGASDDKGQLFVHIKALEAYLRTLGRLPVNVKCLFEGEEEIGSLNMPLFLQQCRDLLIADVAVVSDMRILGPDRPAITCLLRGALSVELEMHGPAQDLHSGTFGGAIHNPLQALCETLAGLNDAEGHVAIAGLYDRVRLWSGQERAAMARVGPTDAAILRDARTRLGWGERGYTLYERTTIRPALVINGICGGYQADGPKSVIPASAVAKLNIRLVPDQDPHEIDQLLRQHIARYTPPTVRCVVRTQALAHTAQVDPRHPAMRAASRAYQRGFGKVPAWIASGGTIPVVSMFQQSLGIPTILMGFALPDDNMHAPNEKMHLPTFHSGVRTSIWFLAEIGLQSTARPVWRGGGGPR